MIAPNKDSKQAKSKSAPRNGRARVVLWGGAVAVVACGVALFLMSGDSKDPDADRPKAQAKGQIAEVTPAAPVPVADEAPVSETNSVPKKEKLAPGTKRHVDWKRPANWDQLTRAQKTRAQPVGRVIKPVGWDDRKLFTQSSDRKIERLMRVQPGRLMLGTVTYNERFVDDFLESLKTPIEFTEEDTEADRALKQAVKDARDDLKAAYDRGEDIVEIMRATEKELHDLAAYKLDLRSLIVEYRKSGEHSDQDVKDYIEAANAMLTERGMEPLRLGEIWFHKSQYDNIVNGTSKED